MSSVSVELEDPAEGVDAQRHLPRGVAAHFAQGSEPLGGEEAGDDEGGADESYL